LFWPVKVILSPPTDDLSGYPLIPARRALLATHFDYQYLCDDKRRGDDDLDRPEKMSPTRELVNVSRSDNLYELLYLWVINDAVSSLPIYGLMVG
jgi:hypothetical protein